MSYAGSCCGATNAVHVQQAMRPATHFGVVPLPVPVGTQAVVGGTQIAMPPQPASLTRHLPPPDVVHAQKEKNYRDVDEQLHQAQLLLEDQTTREKEFLRTQALQAKEVASGRWDQHLRAQEIAAEQEFQKALAQLHESARQMRIKLEEQANHLVVEYQARRTQEEINRHKHEVEMHHWEVEQRAGLKIRTLEEQIAQQQKLQKHLALRHTMVAKRNVDGLPELPLARWEEQLSSAPVGASPYPMAPPVSSEVVAPVASSSPTYRIT